jgi:hypothetical protein
MLVWVITDRVNTAVNIYMNLHLSAQVPYQHQVSFHDRQIVDRETRILNLSFFLNAPTQTINLAYLNTVLNMDRKSILASDINFYDDNNTIRRRFRS